jgi:formylglycine-generating enzyme required for sulfatase activity
LLNVLNVFWTTMIADRLSTSSILLLPLLVAALSGCGAERGPQGSGQDQPDDARRPALALVAAGSFVMGAPEDDDLAEPREKPQREIRISRPFEIAVTETTVGQFRSFVEATGYVTEAERDPAGGWGFDLETGEVGPRPGRNWKNPGFPQTDDHPVVQVSWVDAEAYCAWLSRTEGGRFRLPTEAEWEFAARGGCTTRFLHGDAPAELEGRANTADSALAEVFPAATWASAWNDGFAFTAPVGSFPANAIGLRDVTGNVWEWCGDFHDDTRYAQSGPEDPRGPKSGVMRCIRGGGWYDGPHKQRCSTRAWFKPVFRYCQLSGFRIVREVEL